MSKRLRRGDRVLTPAGEKAIVIWTWLVAAGMEADQDCHVCVIAGPEEDWPDVELNGKPVGLHKREFPVLKYYASSLEWVDEGITC